jgi:subtilase family serine protease
MGVWAAAAMGQGSVSRVAGPSRIAAPIDEVQVVTLEGNVHPLARGEFDLGAVGEETPLGRMILLLEPTTSQQAELDALVEAQHDPGSPLFHRWLTPAEFGARFGASQQNLARVAGWLEGQGFTVEEIAASNRLIVFSGTAGQVDEAFHAAIHRYRVGSAEHIANAENPRIPASLAGIVGGVVSLHDFRRTPEMSARSRLAAPPQYSSGSTHYLFPADFAAIYDLNPLYSAGTTGAGTSIAIVGRSNINLSDVAQFRAMAGLAASQPAVILAGADPGLVTGDQDEATLDVEWSGAVAQAAAVKLVVGDSSATTDGVDLSAEYIVNHAAAPVVSTSYGSCEQQMGTTELAFYNSLWEQAASQGMSAFVASGDAGAAGCDVGSDSYGSGAVVNGLCSSTYATCVGGTEFNEGSNPAQYWSAANSAGYGSALGYMPEEAWNESALEGGTGLWATGGGASSVYAQPAWQKGVSGASGGMRAVPDVALSAAGHDGYMIAENGSYWIISGTSAASPSFAGMMALVVQSQGGAGQGNANAGLYPLLDAPRNPFHATQLGNNSVPGVTGFTAGGAAYNLATGLGSVDGALLVSSWGAETDEAASVDFALTASTGGGTAAIGDTVAFAINATASGAARSAIALTATAPAGITVAVAPSSIVPGTAATVTVAAGSTAATGAQSLVITGTDASGAQSVPYALTVTAPPTLTLTAAASSIAVARGASSTVSFTAATGGPFSGSIGLAVSGLPAGVTAKWSANPIAPATGASANQVTLTLYASALARVGSAGIAVAATGGGLRAAQTVTVQVLSSRGCFGLLQRSRCGSPPARTPLQ